jgi:hypothetical protein
VTPNGNRRERRSHKESTGTIATLKINEFVASFGKIDISFGASHWPQQYHPLGFDSEADVATRCSLGLYATTDAPLTQHREPTPVRKDWWD